MLSKLLENINDDRESLENLAIKIDKYLYEEPTTVVMNGRLFSEILVKRIGKDEELPDLETLRQIDRINLLYGKNIINKEIADAFHIIRTEGNGAVHSELEGELESALKVHRNLYKIITWYIQNYIKADFTIETYKTPDFNKKDDKDSMMIKEMWKEIKGLISSGDRKEEPKRQGNKSIYLEYLNIELNKKFTKDNWIIEYDGEVIKYKNKFFKKTLLEINNDIIENLDLEIVVNRPLNKICKLELNFSGINNSNIEIVEEFRKTLRDKLKLGENVNDKLETVMSLKFTVENIINEEDDTLNIAIENTKIMEVVTEKFNSIVNNEIIVNWINEVLIKAEKKDNNEEDKIKIKDKNIFEDRLNVKNGNLAIAEMSDKRKDETEEKIINGCLIETLNKLKESSKEAVEGLDEFSGFKQYMHVNREMHKELQKLIEKSFDDKKSKLILVCGSAGDGKSHIISYFKNKYPEMLGNFKLWNDATESSGPQKTAMETLNEVLKSFNDENLNNNDEKMILAINLGTLNNFIDSEYSENFKLLKDFVYEKKILEATIEDKIEGIDNNFEFVNFSDYHIYELDNGEAKSVYIKELIEKITNKDKENNIFFKSYCNDCLNCENKNKCHIKFNYEMLSNEKIVDNIISLVIESTVKKKLLISTRALLNFIFDIIVGKNSIKVDRFIFKNKISELKENEFIESLLPNLLFEATDLSFIFKAINELDPMNIRDNGLDDFIIEFICSENPMKYFGEEMNYPKDCFKKLENIDLATTKNDQLKEDLLKLYLRSYLLFGVNKDFNLKDQVYLKYIKDLYNWNKGEKVNLRDLYISIKSSMFKWNGESDSKEINLFLGKKQTKYRISEEIEIKPDLSNLSENKNIKLEKFLDNLKLKYKIVKLDKSYVFEIDFDLYKTLNKIDNGYRPNKNDKSHYIKFVEILENIIECGSLNEKMLFTEKNNENNKKFKLEYDNEFGGFLFGEVSNDGR